MPTRNKIRIKSILGSDMVIEKQISGEMDSQNIYQIMINQSGFLLKKDDLKKISNFFDKDL
ncbi:MAG: hypothetical protein ACTSU2_14245 [Promethearchaeota archaeon]